MCILNTKITIYKMRQDYDQMKLLEVLQLLYKEMKALKGMCIMKNGKMWGFAHLCNFKVKKKVVHVVFAGHPRSSIHTTVKASCKMSEEMTINDIPNISYYVRLQCRQFIPAPVDRSSDSAWLYKTPWITCRKIIQAHQ